MASRILLSMLTVLGFWGSLSHADVKELDPKADSGKAHAEIRQACGATRFPDACASSLAQAHLKKSPSPLDIILGAIEVSAQDLKTAQSNAKSILDGSATDRNRSTSAAQCVELLSMSAFRISSSTSALPRGEIDNARAWMSAALAYQFDCFGALKYVNTTEEIHNAMAFLLSLQQVTSNALSMIFSYQHFGDDMSRWKPPATERDGFWGGDGGTGAHGSANSPPKGIFPPTPEMAKATVCKTGCRHQSVQAAVRAAPANLSGSDKYVIHIKQGIYQEHVAVPLEKTNLAFLGDGINKTVITGNLRAGDPGVSTYVSATVAVQGDGFAAYGLTFENTAGPEQRQAVAFRSDSDRSVVVGCEFRGHQDTLYAHTLRQFYKSCRITGTVDFVFGNAAAVFRESDLVVVPRMDRPEEGEVSVLAAMGRTDPAQATGLVFENCTVDGDEAFRGFYEQDPKIHKSYLGRPWKEYSRVVFIDCYMGKIVHGEGWLAWDGDFALKTLFFGEFGNEGPGAKVLGRVNWASQIPANKVKDYDPTNFIQGAHWIPPTLLSAKK